jgi:hypothetical protein
MIFVKFCQRSDVKEIINCNLFKSLRKTLDKWLGTDYNDVINKLQKSFTTQIN